ncbi:OmpA family protein [Psychrobium sp. 1_MG-2023]|uniref:OmpA family protein n=1 Tax=Psychrobium sp. 1_MG-2023 TaxID=3062624 RepID=UPI000C32A7F2|nr:OmpA family protein [Psychrobium sp. 1_MG-2023]MDP2560978.1 OmpA family protein [Psychrobium sp. 1_MG-2023]PKF54954.1 hypothetical protein CW748_14895 [Alteromonadales bacterium alter-6D02]
MKGLISLGVCLLLAGCGSTTVLDLTKPTTQKSNLKDLDRDGVIEARERCADTYTGANIDNYGCSSIKPISENINLDIKFANASSFINSSDFHKIKQVADFMGKFPGSKVVIEGHSSRQGKRQFNQELSEKRALAVANVLTNRYGISPARVSSIGYGFDKPVNSADTAEAHAQNRRIVATLSGTDSATAMKWTIYTVDEQE